MKLDMELITRLKKRGIYHGKQDKHKGTEHKGTGDKC